MLNVPFSVFEIPLRKFRRCCEHVRSYCSWLDLFVWSQDDCFLSLWSWFFPLFNKLFHEDCSGIWRHVHWYAVASHEEELAGSICRVAFLETPEDGSNKTLRNAGTYRQICTASHSKDLDLLQHRYENIKHRIHFKFEISIADMSRIYCSHL